tara:strand:+ start:43238 stop:43825 length:588 start_codon:yes stop_codon:yes gene_type:complete
VVTSDAHEKENNTMVNALVDNATSTSIETRTSSANRFAKILGTSIKDSAENQTEVASNSQLTNVVEAAGRLIQEKNKIDTRLEQIALAITPSVKAQGGKFDAGTTTANLEEVDVKRLLPKVKISTLLIQLLGEVETKLVNEGGLFDLMLGLDDDMKSQHLIPLLDAIFEKAELTEKAARLYSVKAEEQMTFTKNA